MSSDGTLTTTPDQMGQAVLAGHLLECAGQVTGGYFADPGYKGCAGSVETWIPASLRSTRQAHLP